VSRYYVRFCVADRPGVLGALAAILGEARIGISSVIQPESREGEAVPLILMMHAAPHAAMRGALERIQELAVNRAPPVMLRVETFQ